MPQRRALRRRSTPTQPWPCVDYAIISLSGTTGTSAAAGSGYTRALASGVRTSLNLVVSAPRSPPSDAILLSTSRHVLTAICVLTRSRH